MAKLTGQEMQGAIAAHPQWRYNEERGGTISRTFVFPDFKKAFAFMAAMAEFSESLDHHPEWRNVYNRVEVTLTTHDVGGLSKKDVAWAHEADRLAASR